MLHAPELHGHSLGGPQDLLVETPHDGGSSLCQRAPVVPFVRPLTFIRSMTAPPRMILQRVAFAPP